MYWITPDGSYYEGLFVAANSIPVPQRPSSTHVWENSQWVQGPLPVPEVLSRSQFWQQIEVQGLTASANALIDGLEDPLQKIRAREVTVYERNDAQLIAMATVLNMTSEDIDEFFRQGALK
jgi:hypothetical protein